MRTIVATLSALMLLVTVLQTIAPTVNAGDSEISVVYPKGAPPIASDFNSYLGVNNKRRSDAHRGIDIKGPTGQLVIAAADGVVLETTVERCWGPTIVIDHGKATDGKRIIALYGHLGEMLVGARDRIGRGQVIARLGDNQNRYSCIYGVRHLHFQIGRKHRSQYDKRSYWGYSYFLEDGNRGINPHIYWADGQGKVTCFDPSQTYEQGSLTYPVPCL